MTCSVCGSQNVLEHGGYYICWGKCNGRLLEHVDLKEREKERKRISSPLVESGEIQLPLPEV